MTINTGRQLVNEYEKAFTALGGDPEACDGVLWARGEVRVNPTWSAEDLVAAIERKIARGEATQGWLLGILRALWRDLREEFRAIILERLRPGSLLVLISDGLLPDMSEKEKGHMRAALAKSRHAMSRIDG